MLSSLFFKGLNLGERYFVEFFEVASEFVYVDGPLGDIVDGYQSFEV